MEKLLILGCGGFGRMIGELAGLDTQYESIEYLDDDLQKEGVLGRLDEYPTFLKSHAHAIVAIGNNQLRLQYIQKLKKAGFKVEPFVCRPAFLSPSVKLGDGCFVLPGAVINRMAQIGTGALINCGAVIDHEAGIGAGAHICQNVVVKAACRIEECRKVEAGSVIENHGVKAPQGKENA